jgi:hypothetical protein
MTAERRLAKIERSLSPTELVLHWLEEAHRYDDVEAYGRAIYALGPGALPLERLIDEARHSAEIGCPRGSRERRDQAIRTAIRQTVFLFHLVFQAISLAQAALEREVLTHAALCAYLGLVMADDDPARHSGFPRRVEGLTALRGAGLPGPRSCERLRLPGSGSRPSTSVAILRSSRQLSGPGPGSASGPMG